MNNFKFFMLAIIIVMLYSAVMGFVHADYDDVGVACGIIVVCGLFIRRAR